MHIDLLKIEMRLSEVRSRGGTMNDLVREAGSLTGGLAYLLDPDERIIARWVPPHSESPAIPRLPLLLQAIGSAGEPPLSATSVPPLRRQGLAGHVVAPVVHEGHLFAYLVLRPGAASPLQAKANLWVADRTALHLRGEFLAQQRLARVAWNARANLGRQMIRGTTYDADLKACAEYLGVDLDADRVVVFILERGRPSSSTVDPGRLADLMARELIAEILPIRGSEGVLLAVTVPDDHDRTQFVARIRGAVIRGLEQMGDQHAVAGLSSPTPPGSLRRAYREAREVARCLDRYARPETRAVCCDELGPARLFVANSDEHAVRLFVHDVLGPLLQGGETLTTLLQTLQEFFESGRSIREAAATLSVHENTVRHRLNRVHELTGLDVTASSNDQLSLHTAMLVLRLQGHHAVPGFGRGAPARARVPIPS